MQQNYLLVLNKQNHFVFSSYTYFLQVLHLNEGICVTTYCYSTVSKLKLSNFKGNLI